jgi:transposase-like protein
MGRASYRNGYRPGKVKTAGGRVDGSAPRFATRPSSLLLPCARRHPSGHRNSSVEFYERGLCTQDIEDAATDERGRGLPSRTVVNEITENLWAAYDDFRKRDLSERPGVYLFDRASARGGARHLVDPRGWRQSAARADGGRRGRAGVLRDLRAIDLSDPLLAISDRARHHRAIEGCFRRSVRQPRLVHVWRSRSERAFYSIDDLHNAVKRYIDAYNTDCRPFVRTTSATAIFEKRPDP